MLTPRSAAFALALVAAACLPAPACARWQHHTLVPAQYGPFRAPRSAGADAAVLCVPNTNRRPVGEVEEAVLTVHLEESATFTVLAGGHTFGPVAGRVVTVPLLRSNTDSAGDWDPLAADNLVFRVRTAAVVARVVYSVRAASFADTPSPTGGSCDPDAALRHDWSYRESDDDDGPNDGGNDDDDDDDDGDDEVDPTLVLVALALLGIFAVGFLLGGLIALLRYCLCLGSARRHARRADGYQQLLPPPPPPVYACRYAAVPPPDYAAYVAQQQQQQQQAQAYTFQYQSPAVVVVQHGQERLPALVPVQYLSSRN
eukprot:m51a1_g961 hypothetical protein (314) ;mRNA; r:352165-353517